MGFFADSAKKVVFWNYSRTSWQWDVLCVLILAFIFLTPKSWFVNTSYRQSQLPQSTVAIGVDAVGNQLDRGDIERRARLRAKKPNGQVSNVREVKDANGKVIAYEVDIR